MDAILFSDLLLLLALGVPSGSGGRGPVILKPVRTEADIAALRRFEPREALAPVLEAIRLLRRELQDKVPLIGFAGAPFTLASYMIEGGHSTAFAATKALMYGDPAAWHRLAAHLAAMAGDYLRAQVEAGAQALQLFDSWVGALDEADYREFALPHVRTIFAALRGTGVPVIHCTGPPPPGRAGGAGGDVIGSIGASRSTRWRRGRRRRRARQPGPDPAARTLCATDGPRG